MRPLVNTVRDWDKNIVYEKKIKLMKKLQTSSNTKYSGLKELLNIETMKNYNDFIVSNALKNISPHDTLIDFGAGIGTLSRIFREQHLLKPILH